MSPSAKKWNLIVDVAECVNCQLCTLSVRDEFVDNDYPGYSAAMPRHGENWIQIRRKERGQAPSIDLAFMPVMCQHCDDAPCIKAARNNAVSKRPDGIVLIDPEKAKGQRQIVDSCPYGAVVWNEDKQIPQHWFFDAHLLDSGWAEPRCVTACPTGALQALKIDDAEMSRLIEDQALKPLNPAACTKPRVWYKNLFRYEECFVAGSVSRARGESTECAIDVPVQLYRDGNMIAEMRTDFFGDFKFDELAPNSGRYKIKIIVDQLVIEREFDISESLFVGEISVP